FNASQAQAVLEGEDAIDVYEDKLGTYLVKLSSKSLSMQDSHEVSTLLHCIGDFERMSDHAVNLLDVAKEMDDKKITFSEEAVADLQVIYAAVQDVVNLAVDAFIHHDLALAARVEPLEQVVDLLKNQLRSRHIQRLQKGNCTTELGFIFSDLITNYERIADHCSNIAVCLIEVEHDSFDTHEYLNKIKTSGEQDFSNLFEQYRKQYALPKNI
nr:PhoU domain-containing protein [bacterium]